MVFCPGFATQMFIFAQGKNNDLGFFSCFDRLFDQLKVLIPRGKYNIVVFPVKVAGGCICS
jgi:hypothetical protein